jgi:nitrogen regulatory protein PII
MVKGNPAPYSLICTIVPHGQGSQVVRLSHKLGASGGTIIAAHGTAGKRWLKLFHLDDIRRDLVMTVVSDDCASSLLDGLEETMRFREKNTGIAFSLPVSHLIGTDHLPFDVDKSGCSDTLSDGEVLYHALFIIVAEEEMDDVVDRIRELGAPGASTIASFGSADKTNLVFDIPLAPKKTSILVVADTKKSQEIASDLGRTFDLNHPGKGILFAVPVSGVRGLNRPQENER